MFESHDGRDPASRGRRGYRPKAKAALGKPLRTPRAAHGRPWWSGPVQRCRRDPGRPARARWRCRSRRRDAWPGCADRADRAPERRPAIRRRQRGSRTERSYGYAFDSLDSDGRGAQDVVCGAFADRLARSSTPGGNWRRPGRRRSRHRASQSCRVCGGFRAEGAASWTSQFRHLGCPAPPVAPDWSPPSHWWTGGSASPTC